MFFDCFYFIMNGHSLRFFEYYQANYILHPLILLCYCFSPQVRDNAHLIKYKDIKLVE